LSRAVIRQGFRRIVLSRSSTIDLVVRIAAFGMSRWRQRILGIFVNNTVYRKLAAAGRGQCACSALGAI
jgi:hypothetical protein